tara:strand:+ start:520 stop:852 length:333 start_codon:yes stop_codon:yes gene_type:complete
MPKYLLEVDYSGQGSAGILSSGGSARRAAVTHMIEELGGSVETFYFTFGIRDCIVVANLPDNVSAVAISLAVSASGSLAIKTTVLVTPEEVDAACLMSADYSPPGQAVSE